MYGTYRFNQSTNDHEHVTISRADGLEARGYTRTACQACRLQKLKCSGDKHGCQRCRRLSRKCLYDSSPASTASSSAPPVPPPIRQERNSSASSPPPPVVPAAPPPVVPAAPPTPAISDLTLDPTLWPLTPTAEHFSDSFSDHGMQGLEEQHGASHDLSGASNAVPGQELASSAPVALQLGHRSPNFDDLTALFLHESPATEPTMDSHMWDATLEPMSSIGFRQQHLATATNFDPEPSWLDAGSVPYYQLPTAQRATSHTIPTSRHTMVSHHSTTYRTDSRTCSPVQSPGDQCSCLSTMVQCFEHMGAQGFNVAVSISPGIRLDVVLISLSRGLRTCDIVLGCEKCNACSDNGTLLASIAQQIGIAAEYGALKLSTLYNSKHSRMPTSDDVLLEGPISFGRFKVTSPEARLYILLEAVRGHLTQFSRYLSRMKELRGGNSGAGEILGGTESKITRITEELERLSHAR